MFVSKRDGKAYPYFVTYRSLRGTRETEFFWGPKGYDKALRKNANRILASGRVG